MTFKERLDIEKDNLTKIILFNDRGLFFNLIERSAYAFHTRIKPFKVHVKTLKGLDKPYVSLGVPVDKVDEYLQGMTTEKDEQGNLIAHLNESIDEYAFQSWKDHVIDNNVQKKNNIGSDKQSGSSAVDNKTRSEKYHSENENIIHQCFQEVKLLNLASMTPMETMLYLNSLQQKLKDIKL